MKKTVFTILAAVALTVNLFASPDLTHIRQTTEGDHLDLIANIISFHALSGEIIRGELVALPANLNLRPGDRIKVGILEDNKMVLLEVASFNGNAGDRMVEQNTANQPGVQEVIWNK